MKLRYRTSKVLAPDGRPVLVAEPPYRSAGSGRRFAGFPATRLGPNAALLPHLGTLRARARALRRNLPYIRKALRARVANVIGCGIVPQSLAPTEEQRQELETLWWDWVDDADADGCSTFYGVQMTAAWEAFLAGEVFLRLRPRRADDEGMIPGLPLAVPFQVQLLQAEHCPVEMNEIRNGNRVRAGIEFNGFGKRVAYWMYRDHPEDAAPLRSASDLALVRVPADQVIHLFERLEPGQIRGEPGLVAGLLRAHDKEAFDDATLQRLVVSAMLAVFVTSPNEDNAPLLDDGEDEDDAEIVWSPARVTRLLPGENITTPDLPDVGANYADVQKEIKLELAAAADVPYELFSGDLSDVNYSSIRTGIVEFRKGARQFIHSTFCPSFNRRTWVEFIRTGMDAGKLRTIPRAEWARDQRPFLRVEWIPEGFDWVDPQKEVTAAKEAERAGYTTKSAIIRERGYIPRLVFRERAAELKEAAALGLQFDTDVPNPDKATAAPAPPAPVEDDEETPRQRRARRAAERTHA